MFSLVLKPHFCQTHVQAHTFREGHTSIIVHLCYSSNIIYIMLKKMSYQKMLQVKTSCIGQRRITGHLWWVITAKNRFVDIYRSCVCCFIITTKKMLKILPKKTLPSTSSSLKRFTGWVWPNVGVQPIVVVSFFKKVIIVVLSNTFCRRAL